MPKAPKQARGARGAEAPYSGGGGASKPGLLAQLLLLVTATSKFFNLTEDKIAAMLSAPVQGGGYGQIYDCAKKIADKLGAHAVGVGLPFYSDDGGDDGGILTIAHNAPARSNTLKKFDAFFEEGSLRTFLGWLNPLIQGIGHDHMAAGGATPKPQADPASTIYFTATRLRHELHEGVVSSLAVGATSEPLPATWEATNKRYQYQRMGLYKTKNPDGSRNMAVNIYFPPASSSAAIGAAISSTQAYQNLDYAFKRAAKPAE